MDQAATQAEWKPTGLLLSLSVCVFLIHTDCLRAVVIFWMMTVTEWFQKEDSKAEAIMKKLNQDLI